MAKHTQTLILTRVIIVFASTVSIVYYLLYIFSVPELNFDFDPVTGIIQHVIGTNPIASDNLIVGDQIIMIGDIPFGLYSDSGKPSIASLIVTSNILPLMVKRNTMQVAINWPVTKPNALTLSLRTLQMLPSLIFLSAAMTVFLFFRPIDQRNLLFLTTFSIAAIWASARVVSYVNIHWSDAIYHASTWLLIPHSIHFAWIYPSQLRIIPQPLLRVIYLPFLLVALLDLPGLLPPTATLWGNAILGVGIVTVTVIHFISSPNLYRPIRVMFASVLAIMLLSNVFSLLAYFYKSPLFDLLALLAVAGIPIAYIIPILRKSVPTFEMRTNNALVIILYMVIIFVIVIIANLVIPQGSSSRISQPLNSILTVLMVIVSTLIYPHYSDWVQRKLLGIRIPPRELLQQYSRQITTSLEISRLIKVLGDEIPGSLLIRQVMILRLDENNQPTILHQTGWTQRPTQADVTQWIELAGEYLPQSNDQSTSSLMTDTRLTLTMSVENNVIGLVVFGKRDPDDFYTAGEIAVLQTIIDQAALALQNIDQAQRLHTLYQANIQRTEAERMKLARDLHDEVLGPLGIVMMNHAYNDNNKALYDDIQAAINHIRSIIEDVRPSVLDQGLYFAIIELSNRLSTLTNGSTSITNEIINDGSRYPEDVEVHTYRILLEACMNSIRHGKARQITISGSLTYGSITLSVKNNGNGFISSDLMDITSLLRSRHFGLVGIHERASLIGAEVYIFSTPNIGTQVSFNWNNQTKKQATNFTFENKSA